MILTKKNKCGIALLLMLLATSAFATDTNRTPKLYKWVDDQGGVHFSDKIPPQDIKRQHSEIGKLGLETRTVAAEKTPAEIAKEQHQRAIQAEQDRLAREQATQDHILLDTFSSEAEIIAARNRQLATMDATNQITMSSINSLTHKLEDQTKHAADYERQGKQVPDTTLKEIDDIKLQIEQYRALIKSREKQGVALKEKYQAYVDRFRELKSQ